MEAEEEEEEEGEGVGEEGEEEDGYESPSLPISSPRVVGALPTNSMLIVLTLEPLETALGLGPVQLDDVDEDEDEVRTSESQDRVLVLVLAPCGARTTLLAEALPWLSASPGGCVPDLPRSVVRCSASQAARGSIRHLVSVFRGVLESGEVSDSVATLGSGGDGG